MKGTGSVPFILPFAKGEINILNNAITNYLFSLSQGEKGYYFGRSYYQIIISAKGRKGISITINSTPTTLLPDILGYKFPMQIRIYSRSLKESFFFYLQHFYPLLLSLSRLCVQDKVYGFDFSSGPRLFPLVGNLLRKEYQKLKEFARGLWKFKNGVCSNSVKIPKADSQKIQNMTRFLSNATKSGFAAHHLGFQDLYSINFWFKIHFHGFQDIISDGF